MKLCNNNFFVIINIKRSMCIVVVFIYVCIGIMTRGRPAALSATTSWFRRLAKCSPKQRSPAQKKRMKENIARVSDSF